MRGMCGSRHHHRPTGGTRPGRLKADDLRASDAERDEIVAELREHAGAGRVTVEELDQRVETAYAATTRRELVALVEDLPRSPRPRRDELVEFDEHLRAYLSVMALLVVIWALTGAGYFWPIWPILGWGLGVVLSRPRPGRSRRRLRTSSP